MMSTENFTIWVKLCVSALAIFENVFDITVFVNSMKMYFQTTCLCFLWLLKSPTFCKEIYFILYVENWNQFLSCFPTLIVIQWQVISHLSTQQSVTPTWNELQLCGVVWVHIWYHRPWNELELGALISWGMVSKCPTEWQEVDGDPTYRMFIGEGVFKNRKQVWQKDTSKSH